jgi:hypothetical protein
MDLKNVGDADIPALVAAMEADGIVEIPGFFPADILKGARDYLMAKSRDIEADYFSLRAEDMTPSVLVDIQMSDVLRNLFDRVLDESRIDRPNSPRVHIVVRSITGDSNAQGAHKYHFDAYHLTAAMPVIIPDDPEKDCGDFVLFTRRRSGTAQLAPHLLLKVAAQSRIVRRLAQTRLFGRLFGRRLIRTKPGSLYLFYGFRTYHGNLALDPSLQRVTALLHYADPFEGNRLIKGIEDRRKRPQAA